jgi:nitrile hydratase
MNSIVDMGGMHGFGPVEMDAHEAPFTADWERRILGLTFATLGAGLYNVDEIRRVTENIPPARYLASSYFERWIEIAEVLLMEKRVITADELEAGHAPSKEAKRSPAVTQDVAGQILRIGGSSRGSGGPAAKFKAGDAVVARNIHPSHHTRLPRYIRGKTGIVEIDHGVFALPDTNAHGKGPHPQHVYGVRFKARDLWGDTAPEKDTLQIDLFDDYLRPAGADA